jgi:hypothetical protein
MSRQSHRELYVSVVTLTRAGEEFGDRRLTELLIRYNR